MAHLVWTEPAWEDYLYWQKADKKVLKRINELLRDSLRTPFAGKGKSEALRFELSGCWSRRINREHRLVYLWQDDYAKDESGLIVLQCRYHY